MYLVNGKKYDEDPSRKLGGGSEGSVYPFDGDPDNTCVKLWHPVDPKDRSGQQIALYRAKKVKAVTGLNLHLPEQFILPKLPAQDGKGNIIGYLMRRVPKEYVKLMKLLQPAFRTNNSIGLKDIALLYAFFFEDLEVLQKNSISVGDVNLGGNMVRFTSKGIERVWVDTDSWSYPGFPCLATTEMFCHPDLYANLGSGGKFVPPMHKHDCFAFEVEFCLLALPGAHPFRMGLHPSVTSLQERAEAGITIFDSGVTYPSYLPSPDILSDDLLHELILRLKRKKEEPLPAKLLRDFAEQLVVCAKCSEQYHRSRSNCPKCQEKTIVDLKKLIELIIQEVYAASEAILYTQVVDSTLFVVCRVSGMIHIVTIDEKGGVDTLVTFISALRGMRYRFFGSHLVVCPDVYADAPVPIQIYRITGSTLQMVQNITTNGLENESAVFDVSSRFMYRTAGNTLLCGKWMFGGKVFGEDPVTQVHQTQSWFTVDRTSGLDREAIFGYDRALRDMQWFVVKGDKAGEKFDFHNVTLPAMRAGERLEDFAVDFGADAVLLVRQTLYQGRQYIRYSIIALNGVVVEDRVLRSGDNGYDAWESIHGKLFQKSSILHVTPLGVVKQTLLNNAYELVEDTRGVVTAEDWLFRFNKSVGIARRGAVLTMRKK